MDNGISYCMKVLLLGTHPSNVWVRSFIEGAAESEPSLYLEFLEIEAQLQREQLLPLMSNSVDALILSDYLPAYFHETLNGLSLVSLVRSEAQRAVLALELVEQANRTLTLDRSHFDLWPMKISEFFGLPLHCFPSLPPPAASNALQPGLTSTPLISQYLEPLFAAARGADLLRLIWPSDSFLDGDAPDQILPQTVEVAGRARILAYGPYLPLPRGKWLARAYLGFSTDIGKMPFILEVDTGETVSRGFFEVDRGGIFSVELEFQIVELLPLVELRLISQDSALEGQIALIEIELQCL